jgi:hypothetical protein
MNDPALPAEALNAALEAYVATVPSPPRLRAHLEAQGLMEQAARFELELRATVRTAEQFLYGESGKGQWDAAFNQRYFETVARQHPWISRAGLKRLGSFGQWLNWHEGLGF